MYATQAHYLCFLEFSERQSAFFAGLIKSFATPQPHDVILWVDFNLFLEVRDILRPRHALRVLVVLLVYDAADMDGVDRRFCDLWRFGRLHFGIVGAGDSGSLICCAQIARW